MNAFLKHLDQFTKEAYAQMVVIKGYAPWDVTVFIDTDTEKAVLQFRVQSETGDFIELKPLSTCTCLV